MRRHLGLLSVGWLVGCSVGAKANNDGGGHADGGGSGDADASVADASVAIDAAGTIDAGPIAGGPDAAPVTGFPGVQVFEADACHDLDIAVSPTLVATATNSGHVVFHRRDGSVDHTHDFPGNTGDQHIVWDASSSRWLFSMMNSDDAGGSHMWLFASKDEAGNQWTREQDVLGPTDMDNPNLTVTTDKVVLVNYDCVYPLDKARVLAGTSATLTPTPVCGLAHNDQIYGVDYGLPVPSTAYFVTMSDDGHVNWISVEGTPAAGNVSVQQHKLSVAGFHEFPPFPGVVQQGGTHLRNSGVVAMWHANHLWWSKAGACAGVTCARMFDIRTDLDQVHDFDVAIPGVYVWSAAPGIDRDGNMWTLFSQVSASTPPSLSVAGMSASGVRTAPQIVVQGTAPAVSRNADWGDFFNCAQDPADGSVWCIGNYGGPPQSGCPTPAKVVHVSPR